jgi:hypothetical protein
MIQPPKMSPPGIAVGGHRQCAGRQLTPRLGRIPSPFFGSHPLHLQAADIISYVALQYEVVNVFGNANGFHIATRKI